MVLAVAAMVQMLRCLGPSAPPANPPRAPASESPGLATRRPSRFAPVRPQGAAGPRCGSIRRTVCSEGARRRADRRRPNHKAGHQPRDAGGPSQEFQWLGVRASPGQLGGHQTAHRRMVIGMAAFRVGQQIVGALYSDKGILVAGAGHIRMHLLDLAAERRLQRGLAGNSTDAQTFIMAGRSSGEWRKLISSNTRKYARSPYSNQFCRRA